MIRVLKRLSLHNEHRDSTESLSGREFDVLKLMRETYLGFIAHFSAAC